MAAAVVSAAHVDRDTEARFRQGEREAFLTVYAAHAPALRALVGRFFARPFEREEAVQEVWLLVHRMARSFDPDRGELLPWLRTVAALTPFPVLLSGPGSFVIHAPTADAWWLLLRLLSWAALLLALVELMFWRAQRAMTVSGG